jgi:hypothetical protein
MKRLGSIFLVIFGIALILFGLLFLIGSAGKTHRLAIGAASLALGAVLTGFGIRFFKQADMILPAYIKAEIMEMARVHNGEVSETDIQAKLGRRFKHALDVLADMQAKGLCARRKKTGTFYYVFDDIIPRLTIRRCEFCGAEISLEEELASCPNCGGTIKTDVEKLSLSKGDFFSMDE